MPAARSPRVRSKLDETRKRTLAETNLQKFLKGTEHLEFQETDINTLADQAGLVGQVIKILWPLDDEWYCAKVIDYNLNSGKHKLLYEDGDREWLELFRERVKLTMNGGKLEQGPKGPATKKRRKSYVHTEDSGDLDVPRLESPSLDLDMDVIQNSRNENQVVSTPTKLLMVLAEQAAEAVPTSPPPLQLNGFTKKRANKPEALPKAEDIKLEEEDAPSPKKAPSSRENSLTPDSDSPSGAIVVAGQARPRRAAALKVPAVVDEEEEDWQPSSKNQQLQTVKGRRTKKGRPEGIEDYVPGEGSVSGADSEEIATKVAPEDFTQLSEDDQLRLIAAKDPRKAKRMLANRRSAERSRLRRLELISKLEAEVAALKKERDGYVKRVHKLEENWISEREEKLELRRQLQALQAVAS